MIIRAVPLRSRMAITAMLCFEYYIKLILTLVQRPILYTGIYVPSTLMYLWYEPIVLVTEVDNKLYFSPRCCF